MMTLSLRYCHCLREGITLSGYPTIAPPFFWPTAQRKSWCCRLGSLLVISILGIIIIGISPDKFSKIFSTLFIISLIQYQIPFIIIQNTKSNYSSNYFFNFFFVLMVMQCKNFSWGKDKLIITGANKEKQHSVSLYEYGHKSNSQQARERDIQSAN